MASILRRFARPLVLIAAALTVSSGAGAADAPSPPSDQSPSPPQAPVRLLDINEYEIDGVTALPQIEVERAVYPFLGPQRPLDDIEKARAALEKAFHDRAFAAVSVRVPQQRVKNGVVMLQVVEGRVGKVTVQNARYFDEDVILETVPSLETGKVVDFNEVSRDIVAVNQWPDRRVTPALRAGEAPGTVDVDLMVEDKFPLHWGMELNNRNSADTVPLRFNATAHYDNLWQLGHSMSVSYQVAPERRGDAEVFSASYLARIPGEEWLSLLVYGLHSNSDVSTLGDMNVTGRGTVAGLRATATLPYGDGFFHSLTAGLDYKRFDEAITLGGDSVESPITYYPFTVNYAAQWRDEDASTQLNAGITFHFRGMGSTESEFDNKRFEANANFFYFRGDISHTHALPWGFEGFAKIAGQATGQVLISPEEMNAGGLETVRGYRESEAIGDRGIIGTLEIRSPSLQTLFDDTFLAGVVDEWRFHAFADGAHLIVNESLVDQSDHFDLASAGVGTQFKIFNMFGASVDVGVPFVRQTATDAGDPRATFRIWHQY